MLAVVVLNAAKQRKLVIRTHVELERAHSRPLSVINALAVLPVRFAAGLPVAFEQRPTMIRKRGELRAAEGRGAEARDDHERSDQLPLRSSRRHHLPPSHSQCKSAAGTAASLIPTRQSRSGNLPQLRPEPEVVWMRTC